MNLSKVNFLFFLFFLGETVIGQAQNPAKPETSIEISDAKNHIGQIETISGNYSSSEYFRKNNSDVRHGRLFLYIWNKNNLKSRFLVIVKINLESSDSALVKYVIHPRPRPNSMQAVKPAHYTFKGKVFLYHGQPAIKINADEFSIDEEVDNFHSNVKR